MVKKKIMAERISFDFTESNPDENASAFYRGDSWNEISFKLTEVGRDWTGTTARIQWRKKAGAQAILSWALAVGSGTVTDAAGNVETAPGLDISVTDEILIPMQAPKETSETVAAGTYRYDVEITLADGTRDTFFVGNAQVIDDISRD